MKTSQSIGASIHVSSGHLAQLDLIPMIDIVFQLILFFLVSTTFALLPGISVNLPESDTAKTIETGGIVIAVQADETLWFNNRKVSLAELGAAVASFDTGNSDKREYPVSLEADEKAPNGVVVAIFDVLRQNGFSAVNLRTKIMEE
jgi:biopolymer transport protein ExbD